MHTLRILTLLSAILVLGAAAKTACAQDDPAFEVGVKPFGSYDGGNIDAIDLATGNLSVDIPLISYPQRGGKLGLAFSFHYQSGPATTTEHCNSGGTICWATPTHFAHGTDVIQRGNPAPGGQSLTPPFGSTFVNLNVTVGEGAVHQLGPITTGNDVYDPSSGSGYFQGGWLALDGSGYLLNSNSSDEIVTDPDGTQYTYNYSGLSLGGYAGYSGRIGPATPPALIEDTNGNQISTTESAGVLTGWTDTLGRSIPVPVADTPSASDPYPCPTVSGQPTADDSMIWEFPSLNGGTYPIKLCWVVISEYYQYWNPELNEDNGGNATYDTSSTEIQSILLPNGTAWTFQYNTSNGSGDLMEITFPTGGTLSYTWTPAFDGPGDGGPETCTFYQCIGDVVASRTLNPNDGTGSGTWTYNDYEAGPTTVTDPAGNDTVHSFTDYSGGNGLSFFETSTAYYQGTGGSRTLLKTVNTTFSSDSPFSSGSADYPLENYAVCIVPTQVTTTWANGQESKVAYGYDSASFYHSQYGPSGSGGAYTYSGGSTPWTGTLGKVLTKSEYDYGSGGPGSLLRTTTTAYEYQSNSNYATNNLLNLPASVQVKDGGGTQRAYTTYAYDTTSPGLNSSGITTQHDSSPPAGTYRGNQTSLSRWLSGSTTSTTNCPISVSNGYLVSYITYNDTGTIYDAVDSCGSSATDSTHMTNYTYSSTYVGAFPTTVTNPAGQSTTSLYDFNTGLQTSVTDPNSETTSTTYDSMLRTSEISYPDTGQTSFCYTDEATCSESGPNVATVITEKINSSQSRISAVMVDGLGREIQRNMSNGETTPYDQTDTCYDLLGRVSYKSYAYQSTGLSTRSCSGKGDSTAYDALSRTTSVTHSDSSSVLTSYTGRATSSQDEGNGTQRVQQISQVDGIGRLISICEVTSTTLTVGISGSTTPASCGLDISGTGFLTTYGYDALDDLTSVTQGPLNSRTNVYDSLSRLTSAANPESGTTSYAYDADGNLITKTDARSVTITFAYSKISQMTGKTYSDGVTPAVTYNYGETSSQGISLTNTVGRKSSESTAGSNASASVFSYDPRGRVSNNSQCTPQNCSTSTFPVAYAYDLLGDILTATNGADVTLTNTYNVGARVATITSSLSDSNHPASLFGSSTTTAHYNASGSLISVPLGNGISESRSYDGRFRLSSIADGSLYTLSISTSGGYAPNSDLLAANDSVNGNWTYSYDPFNRLTGSNLNSSTVIYAYAYDRFGNRWMQQATTGTGAYSSLGFNANNQIVSGYGVTYDAAGNVTDDGSHSYFYDAEDRIIQVDGTLGTCSTATACYVYDASGRRIRKTTGGSTVDFVYDLAGKEAAQITSGGVWTRGEVYVGDRHLATYSGGTGGTTYFIHPDWLGTERVRTNVGGTSAETCTSLPFGDWLTCSGTDVSPVHFTGKGRDSESTLDNFEARYFGSGMSRFTSPDPDSAGAIEEDGQSWNGYAYTRNNPLRYTDPRGLDYHVCLFESQGLQSCFNVDYLSDLQAIIDASKGFSLKDGGIYEAGAGLVGSYQYFEVNPFLNAVAQGTQMSRPIVVPAFWATVGFLSSFGPAILEGSLAPAEAGGIVGTESMTNAAAGKIIGWGTDQSPEAVAKTTQLAETLTKDEVKAMADKGLTLEKAQQLEAVYAKALANVVKAASNTQLEARLKLMQKIIQLWPGK